MLTANTLIERLTAAGVAKRAEIRGCTLNQIQEVATAARWPLPRAYSDFLAVAGRGAGGFLRDADVFYPKMLGLNSKACDLLEDCEEGNLVLPARAFVFAMRYGEQFLFFVCEQSADDPGVYHYLENKGRFREVGSFWEVIEAELRISEQLRKNFPDSPLLNR